MVVDLKGLGMSFISNMKFVKLISKIGPPHYPEITERVLVVRAPWIVKMAWAVVAALRFRAGSLPDLRPGLCRTRHERGGGTRPLPRERGGAGAA